MAGGGTAGGILALDDSFMLKVAQNTTVSLDRIALERVTAKNYSRVAGAAAVRLESLASAPGRRHVRLLVRKHKPPAFTKTMDGSFYYKDSLGRYIDLPAAAAEYVS